MRTYMTQDQSSIANTGSLYAVRLVFRDESEPDVFGWAAINDFFNRRCPTVCFGRQTVLQNLDHLRKIMNVSIDGKGKLTEPDASISAGTAADVDATHREPRPFNRVANGVLAQHRKVERVEDILDGRDRLERIEQRLEGLTALLNRQASTIESPYLTTQEAAAYLKSTVKTVYDWVKRGKLHPVPGRRGLFTKEALDRFALTRRRRK